MGLEFRFFLDMILVIVLNQITIIYIILDIEYHQFEINHCYLEEILTALDFLSHVLFLATFLL